jgi:hypothetical protein
MNDISRQATLLQLSDGTGRTGRCLARTQSLTIECVAGDGSTPFDFASATEIFLLLPAQGATVSGDHAADIPGHAVAILPAGAYALRLAARGEAYILATDRLDRPADEAINAEDYVQRDSRIEPLGRPFGRPQAANGIRIYPVEDIAIPPDNGRLRFLQSETMSLNWVEYNGVRDRDALSPHAHDDFEQATLAISGHFLHHVRTPWGRNANLWREDAHLPAAPHSVVIVPPEIVHTTEGVGDGLHILIDIFAPPRRDFIAKNWVFNAADYTDPIEVAL